MRNLEGREHKKRNGQKFHKIYSLASSKTVHISVFFQWNFFFYPKRRLQGNADSRTEKKRCSLSSPPLRCVSKPQRCWKMRRIFCIAGVATRCDCRCVEFYVKSDCRGKESECVGENTCVGKMNLRFRITFVHYFIQ